MQQLKHRARVRSLNLIAIMVGIVLIVLAIAILMLYRTAFEEQREALVDIVQSRAAFMNAVARSDKQHYGPQAFERTLDQIRDAHANFRGFGETGEYTLGRLEGENIVFLLSHRHHDMAHPHPVPATGREAIPMQHALKGEAGWIVGRDYRGESVLAAYMPVKELGLGVVAKIDMKEIRTPFIRAAGTTVAIALPLILIGVWAFKRSADKATHQIAQSELLFRSTFSNAAIGLAHIAPDGSWLRVNDALCRIVGYSKDELLKLSYRDITHPDDLDNDTRQLAQALDGKLDHYTKQKQYIRKDGSPVPVQITVSMVRKQAGEPDYFITAVSDISRIKEVEHELRSANAAIKEKHAELQEAMDTIKTISGIVPLCAWCGNTIRDDNGEWVKVDEYFHSHTDAEVSHGMCPDCQAKVSRLDT